MRSCLLRVRPDEGRQRKSDAKASRTASFKTTNLSHPAPDSRSLVTVAFYRRLLLSPVFPYPLGSKRALHLE